MMQLLPFQDKAVNGENGLVNTFKRLWMTGERSRELIFKSPTGSGKTLMVSTFLNVLGVDPEFNTDVAFVWITFSDELAMQSREKFVNYFYPNIGHNLLTIADFDQGILSKDDILFLNWQKLVAKNNEMRRWRRPEDPNQFKESGSYFEDVVERTHQANREIVMIIDESHKNVTSAAIRDVIRPLDPRIIIKVSATPFKTEEEKNIFKAKAYDKAAGFVEVNRDDVVKEGLVKETIVSQTEEELKTGANQDLDKLLLELAIHRRTEIATEWKRLGLEINPLVLIQLPSDDAKSIEQGIPTKESVVTKFLIEECGIAENKVAYWFDRRKDRLDDIANPKSPIDFMLFKYAAGTGWDCPRAHILVMFREIESPTFKTQTLGRILRNPVPGMDLSNFPSLRLGYLYTNYSKNQIDEIPEGTEYKPKTEKFSLTLHRRIELAKKTLVQESSSQVKEFLVKYATEEMTKEVAEANAETITQKIEPKIESAVSQVIDSLSEDALPCVGEEIIPDRYAEDADLLMRQITSKVKEVVGKQTNESTSNRILPQIADIARNFSETVYSLREAEFIIDPLLKSDFVSRADYNDLGKSDEFQRSFIGSMNRYFGISDNALCAPVVQEELLKKTGVDISLSFPRKILVDAHFQGETDIDGHDAEHEISENEAEKLFTNICYHLLEEQTEESAKYGNIQRSWGPFKTALRLWFRRYAMSSYDDTMRYKVFLKDIFKDASSRFRPAITDALKEYRPIRDKGIEKIRQRDLAEGAKPFRVKTTYAYASDCVTYENTLHSLVQPFKIRKNHPETETDFIEFLERESGKIEWWFKQDDEGKDFYSIRYFNTTKNKDRLFYPDFLVKFKNGCLGIFDTKDGMTASHPEGREIGLYNRLRELNKLAQSERFVGGLVVNENGQWYYNTGANYRYSVGNLDAEWKRMLSLFN